MNGRLEKELKAKEKMEKRLDQLPSIFTDFYYFLSNKSYLTRYNYIEHIADFMNFINKKTQSNEFYINVTPIDINKYMESIKTYKTKTGMKRTSDSALAARWSSLNTFYKFLCLMGLVKENIVEKTERPRVRDEKKKPALNQTEIKNMTKNIEMNPYRRNRNRDKLILSLGVTIGLRVSAISQLNIDDIDVIHNTLQVIEKGDKYRVIEFGENLKNQFISYIKEREDYYGKLETKALFVSQKKQRISNNTIRELLAKYANGATDKHVSAHTLRRTSASLLYNKTGDIYLVGNHLGHADISTTKRYISIDEERQKSKVEFMDSVI